MKVQNITRKEIIRIKQSFKSELDEICKKKSHRSGTKDLFGLRHIALL